MTAADLDELAYELEYKVPPHMSAEIVGPMYRFRHGAQVRVEQSPPLDTRDPRYLRCTDHHLACDCREAELAEGRTELWSEYRELYRVLKEMIAGHSTEVTDARGQRRNDLECQCQLCEFARRTSVPSENRRSAHRGIRPYDIPF